ncbi:MAG: diguanylate cyclase [Woeseiaceae bacterium]
MRRIKALIIESTDYYSDVLKNTLSEIGVESDIYSTGEAALHGSSGAEYAFIIVSRYLSDMNGDLFLYRYREKFSLSDALTIMLTSDDISDMMLEANEAGFKLVFNKKDIDSIQTFFTRVVNNRTLDLKGKILYIEDQISVANATIALFESYLTDIDHATTVSEAKAKFIECDYDLVITDYYLQGNETGDDVINFVRDADNAEKSRIPILMVSGENDPAKRTSFLRNGANDFIIKPFNEDEIIVRSSNLIENYKLHKQAKKQEIELLKLAMTDQLTGLYNRHSLFEISPKYLSNARRYGFPVALLVFDLDHFKDVNDNHGHNVGDFVLKTIGALLKNMCREEDFVGRIGGEEFVMILTNCDQKFALLKAEEIREKIELSKPNDLVITSSIGMSELEDDDDFETFFEKADKALYEAKATGRNKIVSYSK